MTEFRRLRTQDERGPEAWRRVAESRPGFATYEHTRAGDPSWLRRANPSLGIPVKPEVIARALDDGPPPVDGETCKQWCGYCHHDPDPAPEREQMGTVFPDPPRPHTSEWLRRSATTEGPATPDDPDELRARMKPPADTSWLRSTPPRRRWWHRYTRRNP